jgi:hypothetical protein
MVCSFLVYTCRLLGRVARQVIVVSFLCVPTFEYESPRASADVAGLLGGNARMETLEEASFFAHRLPSNIFSACLSLFGLEPTPMLLKRAMSSRV